jgi:spore germination protein YaaH
LTGALHAALPGVRVQAWLGAHPIPGQLRLGSAVTRASVLGAVDQVLDDSFDGVHYDFEPVSEGDTDLLRLLNDTHALTRRRHAVLSISASLLEPWPAMAASVRTVTGRVAVWSAGYLHRVAVEVDQVAFMAYDTTLWTETAYGGYVRRATEAALRAVPADVALFIGVPAYHDENLRHHRRAETMRAALRGVRLALGTSPPKRDVGVAIYVDFTVTAEDWANYRRDWG